METPFNEDSTSGFNYHYPKFEIKIGRDFPPTFELKFSLLPDLSTSLFWVFLLRCKSFVDGKF